MAESLELLFGMTGDSAVASRINALNRSFKSLDRTAKGFSKLASGAASFGAMRGGIQSVFSPENLALLNRHIVRPIALDMRKLARFIKTHPALKRAGSFLSSKASQIANSEVMKKIKDYMDVNFKKLSSAIGSQLKKLAPALSSASKFLTSTGAGIAGLFAGRSIVRGSLIALRRYSLRSRRNARNDMNRLMRDTFGSYSPGGNILTRDEYQNWANRYERLRRRITFNRRVADVTGSVSRGYRAVGRGINVASSAVVSAVRAIFPYAMIATAVAGLLAATDRRVEAFFKKWAQKGEYYLSKALSRSAMGWSYILKSATYSITGSKYMAFDASKMIAQEIKNRGVNSPQDLKRWVDHNLKLNNEKWEANNEDFKNNLIMEINALSEKRLKPIDDLMYTQMRDSRL